MFLRKLFFSFFLILLASVSCVDKEQCDLTDEACVTNSAARFLKFIVAGNKSRGLKSLEPIYVKTINANLCHYMDYSFTDVYMYGMKNCTAKKLKFITDSIWDYYLICPQMVFKADYVEKGMVDSVPIEGKGKVVVTLDNFHMSSHGGHETITGTDGKPHMNITNYKFDLLDAKDNVIYKFTSLFSTDEEKSEKVHKLINDNCKKLSGEVKFPIMYLFMDQFLNNINKYLTLVTVYEMFYKYP